MQNKHRMADAAEPPRENEVKETDVGLQCVQCKGDWYACDCPRLRADGSQILEPEGMP